MKPDFSIEADLPFRAIAGIDEVGRGPWAGPVLSAVVILDPERIPAGLNDSKQLSHKRRVELAEAIHATAQVGIGQASVEEIDQINILKATYLSMHRALEALPVSPEFALVDGNRIPTDLPCRAQGVVKGDARCLSIAAASIVAKVARDEIMVALSQQFPGYSWETNKGYGTQGHASGLTKLGVTPHHRRSFKPIHNMLSR